MSRQNLACVVSGLVLSAGLACGQEQPSDTPLANGTIIFIAEQASGETAILHTIQPDGTELTLYPEAPFIRGFGLASTTLQFPFDDFARVIVPAIDTGNEEFGIFHVDIDSDGTTSVKVVDFPPLVGAAMPVSDIAPIRTFNLFASPPLIWTNPAETESLARVDFAQGEPNFDLLSTNLVGAQFSGIDQLNGEMRERVSRTLDFDTDMLLVNSGDKFDGPRGLWAYNTDDDQAEFIADFEGLLENALSIAVGADAVYVGCAAVPDEDLLPRIVRLDFEPGDGIGATVVFAGKPLSRPVDLAFLGLTEDRGPTLRGEEPPTPGGDCPRAIIVADEDGGDEGMGAIIAVEEGGARSGKATILSEGGKDGHMGASGVSVARVPGGDCPAPGGDCPADQNEDGDLDIDDFSSFVTNFFDSNMRADVNRDSSLDIDDFSSFVTEFFTAGGDCP